MADGSSAATPAAGSRRSPNFGHLAAVDPLLEHQGAQAERYVFEDPVTALFRLRQFAETMAQQAAATTGLYATRDEPQHELLRRLRDGRVIDREVADLFHAIRQVGNRAVHQNEGTRRDALRALRIARRLGVWFQRAFRDPGFEGGPFVPPPDPPAAPSTGSSVDAPAGTAAGAAPGPSSVEQALRDELAELRRAVAAREAEVAQFAASVQEQAEAQARAEAAAAVAYEELTIALELAGESEARAAELEAAFQAQVAALQAQVAALPGPDVEAVIQRAQEATEALDLDESETRLLIDVQLREAGWEADTVALSHRAGVRPAKGRNMAIAEWPTTSGPADYVLFAGLTPLAVVEAKRQRRDVAGAIEQAKRYGRAYGSASEPLVPGAPWGDARVPFLFATNGRPFLRQLRTQSGIWFLDARRPTNHPRPLEGWYTPEGLLALLGQDVARAEAKLAADPPDLLPLRDYQRAAIAAVEAAIARGRQDLMLAMATGTGKTRTALCLIYRLLKARRFRRVLFLVDRTALGEQALGAFQDVRLENLQPLTEIYDVKGLGDLRPDPDTRLHLTTVQGMVRRLMAPAEDAAREPAPAVDWYDCLVVDECHRGYALDREMTDSEVQFRSEADYISKYRRVLDHFDAVRIGLTATPALHTTEIFGPPVFEYGYRRAVLDGYLVDHEPPIRLLTKLNQGGIHWAVGEEVAVYDSGSGQLALFETPDEIAIEVDGFNTQVVTEPFNRVVCRALAEAIDPSLPGKTLVFCATDAHADLVVDLLKQAFAEVYGEVEDAAVQKITGAADRPLERIRHFKNERLPSVAVTVDLLTTGIDVPEIVNLVFLRRVRSRILYEQMLGRATRLCPAIGKEHFRIYDAVDLYAALAPYTAMKPVVTRPTLTFAQLVGELLTVPDEGHRRSVLDELTAKLQARRRRLAGAALDAFEGHTGGASPEGLLVLLRAGDAAKAATFFEAHAGVATFLDDLGPRGGRPVYVSEHEDELLGTERGYGPGNAKPEDYLAGFGAFIEAHRNALDALMVVTQRPRDLTRGQLRELKLALDAAGYTESALRAAWAQVSDQDIAASIIGFIRQQALGCPLVPYAQRVDRALERVLASNAWSPPQRQWLERIGKQMKSELVVDRETLDRGQFAAQGGYDRLNRIFGGKLESVLGALHEGVWQDAGYQDAS